MPESDPTVVGQSSGSTSCSNAVNCPSCFDPMAEDHNSFWCRQCHVLYPKETIVTHVLSSDQLAYLNEGHPKALAAIVADLADPDDPSMSISMFVLAMSPLFQRKNITPRIVKLACLEVLASR